MCASPAPELRSALQLRDRGGGVCGRWPACDGAATASPRGESRIPSGAGASPRDSRRGPFLGSGLSSRVQRGRPLAPRRGPLLWESRPVRVGLSRRARVVPESRRGRAPRPPCLTTPAAVETRWFAVVADLERWVKPPCALTCRAAEAPCSAGSDVRHLFMSV